MNSTNSDLKRVSTKSRTNFKPEIRYSAKIINANPIIGATLFTMDLTFRLEVEVKEEDIDDVLRHAEKKNEIFDEYSLFDDIQSWNGNAFKDAIRKLTEETLTQTTTSFTPSNVVRRLSVNNATLEDVNECAKSVCPENSICVNVYGSFYCKCAGGFGASESDVSSSSSTSFERQRGDLNCVADDVIRPDEDDLDHLPTLLLVLKVGGGLCAALVLVIIIVYYCKKQMILKKMKVASQPTVQFVDGQITWF